MYDLGYVVKVRVMVLGYIVAQLSKLACFKKTKIESWTTVEFDIGELI
jgi:hypothetical protein